MFFFADLTIGNDKYVFTGVHMYIYYVYIYYVYIYRYIYRYIYLYSYIDIKKASHAQHIAHA